MIGSSVCPVCVLKLALAAYDSAPDIPLADTLEGKALVEAETKRVVARVREMIRGRFKYEQNGVDTFELSEGSVEAIDTALTAEFGPPAGKDVPPTARGK